MEYVNLEPSKSKNSLVGPNHCRYYTLLGLILCIIPLHIFILVRPLFHLFFLYIALECLLILHFRTCVLQL